MTEGKDLHMVIITGMSGAGKSVAMRSFEDMGYFCVDNLPPTLLPKFIELIEDSNGSMDKIALVMDLRGRDFFDHLFQAIDDLSQHQRIKAHLLFLDATDEALVHRYKETRRSHPLEPNGSPLKGIQMEREMLDELKGSAQQIIDTTNVKPRTLRDMIIKRYTAEEHHPFTIDVMSFGFKYGLPIDADLVFDVRFLPNPHYIDSMRPKTGLDDEVSSYVLKWSETKTFLNKLIDMFHFVLPQYKREGKNQLVIGIGCTGGKHRSVTIAEYVADAISDDYTAHVTHRDIEEGKDKT